MNIYRIKLTMDPRAVLGYKSKNGGELTERFFAELVARMSEERIIRLEKTFNGLSIAVCSSDEMELSSLEQICLDAEEVIAVKLSGLDIQETTAKDVLKEGNLTDKDKQFINKLIDGEDFEETDKKEPCEEQPAEKKKAVEPEEENIFETIDNLIAVGELKSWAKEMQAIYEKDVPAELLKRSLLSMTYLISVNGGNGVTTIAESMAKVICKMLDIKSFIVREYFLDPDAKENESFNKAIRDLEYAESGLRSKLNVFVFDIEKIQGNKNIVKWIDLLNRVRDCSGQAAFIFTVPYMEKSAVNKVQERINDILPCRTLFVKPMTNEDYMKFFEKYFKKLGITVDDSVYAALPGKIAEERADGRFYGIDTINKICDEILYNKINSAETNYQTVTFEDVKRTMLHADEGEKISPVERLENLVGLENVKQSIKDIVATIHMQKKMNLSTSNSMHMMFSGAPGTGKTVVARLLGEIFCDECLLSGGGFYEVSRKDLVGSYVGQTAPKTSEVCKLAYGSVLFIDEAYMLDGGDQDFGKEAIGTLIAEMENKRDNFVVIFAGYEKELEKLFDLNPGLRDRIPYRINFNNYSREQLFEIFKKMIPKEFEQTEGFLAEAESFFTKLSDDVMENPNFSNARFARNLVERVISKAALRIQMDGEEAKLTLTDSDIKLAVSDSEFSNLNEKRKTVKIGF